MVIVVKQLHPTKAPGPDGLSAVFFHTFWEIVGRDVTEFCLNVLNGDGRLEAVNETNITLIPKTDEPKNMTQFRPISLCNVIYKIVAKMLANRLKLVLSACIGECQSAFIPGRLISDNVMVPTKFYIPSKQSGQEKEGMLRSSLI